MEGMENIVTALPTISPNIETSLTPKNVMLPTIPVLLHYKMEYLLKDVQVLIHLPP